MESYSEMVRRPEKSQFSLTCSRLSQYIKEKGCPVDLGFGMPTRAFDPAAIGNPEVYRPPTTMRLLPGVDFAGDENAGLEDDAVTRKSMRSMEQCRPQVTGSIPAANLPEKAQLTIFYDGKVLVFDDFPAEKAEDLMQLASKGSISTSGVQTFSFSPPTVASDQPPVSPSPANPPVTFSSLPNHLSDPPLARKASLHRFLEKRRERINGRAPYQPTSSDGSTISSIPANQEEKNRQPWLGLGSRILNSGV